jgi:hypothetical protein
MLATNAAAIPNISSFPTSGLGMPATMLCIAGRSASRIGSHAGAWEPEKIFLLFT